VCSLLKEKDKDGMTCLMHAVRGGHANIVKKILDCSIDDDFINALNDDKLTALAFAAQSGSYEILDILISKGQADVNTQLGSQTALTLGLQQNFSNQCCIRLLTAGSDVTVRGWLGCTPLRHAGLN
jgi:ankyrin repeat protein